MYTNMKNTRLKGGIHVINHQKPPRQCKLCQALSKHTRRRISHLPIPSWYWWRIISWLNYLALPSRFTWLFRTVRISRAFESRHAIQDVIFLELSQLHRLLVFLWHQKHIHNFLLIGRCPFWKGCWVFLCWAPNQIVWHLGRRHSIGVWGMTSKRIRWTAHSLTHQSRRGGRCELFCANARVYRAFSLKAWVFPTLVWSMKVERGVSMSKGLGPAGIGRSAGYWSWINVMLDLVRIHTLLMNLSKHSIRPCTTLESFKLGMS